MESVEEIKSRKHIFLDKNLLILFGCTLMGMIGFTSVTPAFPRIVQELKISPQNVGLLISMLAFPTIIFALIFGVIADRFGRRRVLAPSLFLFSIAGTACAFVRDFSLLLVLRFFQGIGAVSLLALSATIIGDLYSGMERTRAMSYNVSVIDMGLTAFPIIGGVLATLGWYYPFLLPIVAIPIGLLVLYSLNNPEPRSRQDIKRYFKNAWACLKNRDVIALYLASTVTFIILFGAFMTYLPLLIGYSFGASPFNIGLIISGMSLTAAFVSTQVGKLAKIYSEKNLIKAAFFLYAMALFIVPSVSNIWLLLIPVIIFGIGHGLNEPSIHTLLAGCATAENRATIMSLNWMVIRLGITLGPILMGIVFVIWGMNSVFFVTVGLSLAMFVLALIMMK